VDREEQRAVKFTLDKESPIQGQEPQASGDVSREGRIFLIVTNTGVESVIGGKSRLWPQDGECHHILHIELGTITES
jgi:hypothetical protein